MKELLIDARAPKLLLVGPRGSGKSSLINAIFGEYVAEISPVTERNI